jgi:hypothetical protein
VNDANYKPARVDAYAGYRGDEEPRALWVGDRRVDIAQILRRWVEPEARYFDVQLVTGGRHRLRCAQSTASWQQRIDPLPAPVKDPRGKR